MIVFVWVIMIQISLKDNAGIWARDTMQHHKDDERLPMNIVDYHHQYIPDYLPHETGSNANCHGFIKSSFFPYHRDNNFITVSCRKILYRISQYNIRYDPQRKPIIIGILSSGLGADRRQSIRQTWASAQTNVYANVFFLVAGPWTDSLSSEYETYHDLLWINEEEVYDGEKSVLTYKTLSFVSVFYELSKKLNWDFSYLFKSDDDSYINIHLLYSTLFNSTHDFEKKPFDYWGWCQRKHFQPLREPENKWSVSYKTYPEPSYPRYCQGAGFTLSIKFVDCLMEGKHIANTRFMPFEDVAVGMLAERCSIEPYMVEDQSTFKMYRTDTQEEKWRVNQGLRKIDVSRLPIADMRGKIVQHRIYSDIDMLEYHRSILDSDYVKEKLRKKENNEYYYYKEKDEK